MRIGICPVLSGSAGGIYQYGLTMLRALYDLKDSEWRDEFVVFADNSEHPCLTSLNGRCWAFKPLHRYRLHQRALSLIRMVVGEGPHREALRILRRHLQANRSVVQIAQPPHPDSIQFRPQLNHWFRRCGIELMLYPAPTSLSFEARTPYIMAIHDLQHRIQPEFPEVSANGEWERREYLFRNGTRHALLLLADSEVGKEDILHFYGEYGITPDRVKVLPFLPASYLTRNASGYERQRVRETYHLPERYLFYPAQFWPHKNHARVVQALGHLKRDRGLTVAIVFCGSHEGEIRERTFNEVISLSHQLGIEDEIYYLGYVPEEDMSGLYAEALALVIPTFFGPTNIPVLEAWAFGCPVLTSDIRGIREHVGDAAILVDPRSVEAIGDAIYRLWTEETLRRTFTEHGHKRLSSFTSDAYHWRLNDILEEAKVRLVSEMWSGRRV